MTKLGAQELREYIPTKEDLEKIKRNDIYIILDNVLDTYNVGAIFRLADAIGAKKVFLCGGTETPPNSKIKKASVSTWQWIEWEYKENAIEAINKLKRQFSTSLKQISLGESRRVGTNREVSNIQIVAVEQAPNSVPYDKFDYHRPIALVVGHESEGISPETLNACDVIVELPMLGVNKSLNVMVSLGIVLYEVVEKTTTGSA